MNARANKLADDSIKTLEKFSDATYLETETSSALKHHSTMLDRSLKILNTADDKQSNNIVVHNTVVVRDNQDVPPVPDELIGIIEGEIEENDR
jgi:hypothetical protein